MAAAAVHSEEPCVSLLDFWLSDGHAAAAVYAHSMKRYGNVVELATIQRDVARRLGTHVGPFTMIVKSAHIYDTEIDYMQFVLAAQ